MSAPHLWRELAQDGCGGHEEAVQQGLPWVQLQLGQGMAQHRAVLGAEAVQVPVDMGCTKRVNNAQRLGLEEQRAQHRAVWGAEAVQAPVGKECNQAHSERLEWAQRTAQH